MTVKAEGECEGESECGEVLRHAARERWGSPADKRRQRVRVRMKVRVRVRVEGECECKVVPRGRWAYGRGMPSQDDG